MSKSTLKPTYFKQILGHELAFYESTGIGEIILLIGGNSTDASYFLKQINSPLGKKFKVITFDFPGHGQSPLPRHPREILGLFNFAKIVAELIQSFGKPIYVFGHSIGGNILLYALAAYSIQVKGIMLSGTILAEFVKDIPDTLYPHPVANFFFQREWNEEIIHQIIPTTLFQPNEEDLAFYTAMLVSSSPDSREEMAFSLADASTFLGHPSFLKNTLIPLLILEGVEDLFIKKSYIKSLILPTLYQGNLIQIANSAHCPHWENAEEVNEAINEFISHTIQ
jgi:pimeloyl-ACP methyl ester carboxylesterase